MFLKVERISDRNDDMQPSEPTTYTIIGKK